jgi:EpsD family peptidyl-prolyl cis-trans isomerase
MIQRPAPSRLEVRLALLGAFLAAVLVAVGCSGDSKDKPATQTAARVNKEEITVHQINAILAQQRGLRPEQADEAGRRALERLIDQELAVQKAAELKIDRNPRVVQQLEAARREIVTAAYRDKLGEGAAKPSPGEIKAYYDQHPALFSRRKVYQVNEVAIQADAGQVDGLRAKLTAAKSLEEFVAHLKSGGFKFTANQAVRAAEQVPLGLLPQLAEMKDGSSLFNASPDGALVIHLAASKAQPVDLERASPAIEQFLLNERKRKIVADDLKALRAVSKIEYLGKYAASAPRSESIKAPTAAEVAASAAATLDVKSINEGLGLNTGAKAASAIVAADAVVKAASGVDASTITKGLGLK